MTNKVDIIIVYWKTDIFINKCIYELLKTDYDNYKIYIVDNTINSKGKLKSYFDSNKIKIIKGEDPENRKKSGLKRGRHHVDGLQIGIEQTNSDYVAIFHSDSWPLHKSWLQKCFTYLNMPQVLLVGIQHESSIHSCFQFFKREILQKLCYHYNKRKVSFGEDKRLLKRYVKYPQGVKTSRKRWDWGEDLSIEIYKRNRYTVGFNPVKGFSVLEPENKYIPRHTSWRKFGADGYGIIYGDLFFHIWKSWRKTSNSQLLKYKKIYENDKYLDNYYFIDQKYNKIVINKSIHNNYCYAFKKEFIYHG